MISKSRREDVIRRYAVRQHGQDAALKHLICLPAIIFSLVGLLFAINIGISLIALAVAILYYSRFGERVAVPIGTILLLMLAIWAMLMPAHHLAVAALAILLAASALLLACGDRRGVLNFPLAACRQFLLAGPVYGLAMVREKLSGATLAEQAGLDPR